MPHGAVRDTLNLQPGMKVGLFGGSFNPAHEGHAHVAETALIRLGLDRIVWLVSPQNPLKSASETASLDQRMASARRFAANPRMVVSDFETRTGCGWTVDTLRAVVQRHPAVHFVWIMGSDNLESFHLWRGWMEIARMMPIAVVGRPGSLIDSRMGPAARRLGRHRVPIQAARLLPTMAPPAWVFLRAPLNPASSTALRQSAPPMRT